MPQVNVKKVRRWPAVMKRFKRMGRFAFDRVVKTAAYVRTAPGTNKTKANGQVNTASITGLPALKANGKK
jgi:hypothetical protein